MLFKKLYIIKNKPCYALCWLAQVAEVWEGVKMEACIWTGPGCLWRGCPPVCSCQRLSNPPQWWWEEGGGTHSPAAPAQMNRELCLVKLLTCNSVVFNQPVIAIATNMANGTAHVSAVCSKLIQNHNWTLGLNYQSVNWFICKFTGAFTHKICRFLTLGRKLVLSQSCVILSII